MSFFSHPPPAQDLPQRYTDPNRRPVLLSNALTPLPAQPGVGRTPNVPSSSSQYPASVRSDSSVTTHEEPSSPKYSVFEDSAPLLPLSYPRSNAYKLLEKPSGYHVFDPSVFEGFSTEADDDLHAPNSRDFETGAVLSRRGMANLGCLIALITAVVFLFAGYPILAFFNRIPLSTLGGYNVGGVNGTGQVPSLTNFFTLIDPDTPSSAAHHTSLEDQSQWDLVFSDEFNQPNRSFYPGDDPYWEAVDLHYYETGDLEYYDPAAITTGGGALQITLSKQDTHGLQYQGGMLQSWNKFCFTGGYIEVWTMGNLGRAGYGASTDGTWPYSYDSCDLGTLPNQTFQGMPAAALSGGDPSVGGALSFLPGQRLSACTCPGEHHPGPIDADGSFVGRSAPEIDVLEAIVIDGVGKASQSAQWAPFDDGYNWANGSTDATIFNSKIGGFNTYRGGAFQESTSGLFTTDQTSYSGNDASGAALKYSTYGFEYKPGVDGYITWVNNGIPSWSLGASAVGANSRVNISARPISQEPMYLLANLGISPGFGEISPSLTFPVTMYIDYIRVYQDPKAKNIGCSPPNFPTESYINSLPELYNNPNLTTFVQAGQQFPRNRLIETCS
ncbi:glycoside hydrolase family 16 protein [Hydnum rufescens UP504]|uniref:Glycoside hydrolase family 16 protein n=1 Tax=Hydnum rufescens UP504 TaxID=1448309 RepID=A0A9P6AZ42_9AGAM|nr:glycoside hydrolase family 16 protein [Hydnum rufescens UP504]